MEEDPDFEYILVDSTIIRTHQHSAGAQKGGAEAQALRRSRGGISSKIYLATDALGNPVRLVLTVGQLNDITQIELLLEGLKADFVLADKGYDGARAMHAIAAAGATEVVPRRTTTAS